MQREVEFSDLPKGLVALLEPTSAASEASDCTLARALGWLNVGERMPWSVPSLATSQLTSRQINGTLCYLSRSPDPSLRGRDARFTSVLARLIAEQLEREARR